MEKQTGKSSGKSGKSRSMMTALYKILVGAKPAYPIAPLELRITSRSTTSVSVHLCGLKCESEVLLVRWKLLRSVARAQDSNLGDSCDGYTQKLQLSDRSVQPTLVLELTTHPSAKSTRVVTNASCQAQATPPADPPVVVRGLRFYRMLRFSLSGSSWPRIPDSSPCVLLQSCTLLASSSQRTLTISLSAALPAVPCLRALCFRPTSVQIAPIV